MRKLTVKLRWSPDREMRVGQLAQADRRIYFEYDADFLDAGLQLSPFKLRSRPGLIEHTDRQFGPLPGLIDDSLPDGWGLLLMDRLFRRKGIDPGTISPLDRLAYLGTRTMGALTYHPPAEVDHDDRLLDLHELGRNAQQVARGESVEALPQLIRAGGSPGGARPKVLIGLKGSKTLSGETDLPPGYEHWIVKFGAKADARDAGAMEFAYAAMAKDAGIDLPETRLFAVGKGAAYFGVKRFDRGPGNARTHVHTFANLIHADFRIPSTDYGDLLKVTQTLTRNHVDLLRCFRRMVFNIAAHNRDDHAKNFAFMMDVSGNWSLSPAYDLGFASGPGGEHTMTVAGEGLSPSREHVTKLRDQVGISPKEAAAIMDEINAAVSRWARFANAAGCSKKTIREIGKRIKPL